MRLYPTPEQEIAFAKIAGCCRLLYNLGLEQRRDHWRRYKTVTGKTISWYDQKKEIKALKAVAPFLAEVPNHCLQETLHNLHTAYTRFFEGASGYPKPRRKFDNDSFTFPDPAQIKMKPAAGLFHLPKFNGSSRKDDNGPIRALFHRKIRGDLRSVTISRSGTQWYASVLMGVEVTAPPQAGAECLQLHRPRSRRACALRHGAGRDAGYIIETARMMEREKRLRRTISRCIPAPPTAARRRRSSPITRRRWPVVGPT